MLFESRFKHSISRLAQGATEGANIGGEFRRKRFLIPNMRLGKEDLGSQVGIVVLDHKDNTLDFDGVLSMRAMRIEKIGFDFENHEMTWEK